jgi:hypothetical protein
MLLEQFLNKQLIDMHGASNIIKSGSQFVFIRKCLQNTTFTIL